MGEYQNKKYPFLSFLLSILTSTHPEQFMKNKISFHANPLFCHKLLGRI